MSFELNDFFESIKVIVDGRLSDLSYDTTVVATITDDSDKERGHYVVSDGTITFDAYVNDMNYKSGDQVRVSIMNGDWSKKKFIIGLYSENAQEGALTYIPPLGNVFSTDFSNNNIVDNTISNFTLMSNGTETVRRIWGKQITKDSSEYALQANGVYNVITLSGAFQTQLGALSAGGYGLKLDLYSKTEVNSNERINRFITFDSSEMIGNPYSFVIDSYQQKQIAIGFDGIIDEIVLSIYQGVTFDDEGNEVPNLFYDKDNFKIEELPINFKNMVVGFGSNLTSIEDNSLKFYTPDSTTYKYHNGEGDASNDKRLGLIWYNKNKNNGYVGYSDGIYSPEYDEIQYLKFAHTDSRLTRNSGKTTVANDELSLTLAANIEDSEPYMTNIYEALTTSLSSELQALGREISGWETLKTQVNQFITSYVPEGETESVSAKLVQARDKAEAATQNWVNLYAKVLQHGYNLQNAVYTSAEKREAAVKEIEDWFNNSSTGCGGVNPYKVFTTVINGDDSTLGVKAEIEALFTYMEEQTRVDSPMAGYRSFYNKYKARVDTVLKDITTNMSKVIASSTIGETTDEDFNWFSYYKTHIATTDYPPYEKPESAFAEYANKYCMYLYRYVDVPTLEYDETEGADNTEYLFGRFLGPNWERVKLSKDENGKDISVVNPYLPEADETIVDEDGNEITYYKASASKEIFLNLRMDPVKDIEKYQIVFFHNHEQILSNVLVFTNLEAEDIPPQFTVSANDVIQIEHGSYSQDHYQAYSQANDLVNIADESRRRMLQCTYDGVLSGNEAFAGAEIFWYIPVNSTMLTYDRKYLVEELGFFCDDNNPTELSKEGYIYFSKTIDYDSKEVTSTDIEGNPIYDSLGNEIKETEITIHPEDRTFCYKIKSYYEQSAQNNTILVEAHIKDSQNRTSIVKGELPLTFSSFGTNGTNYTLTLAPNTSQIASLPPTAEVLTQEEWGALADDDRLKTLYGSYEAYVEAEGTNPELVLNLGLRNGDGELLTLNEGFNISVMPEEETSDEEITTQELTIKWYATNGIADSVLTLLEAGADSKERLVQVARSYDSDIPYVGIASASVKFKEELSDGTPRTLKLSTMYPIPYASSKSYYISGPTMIIYNNQGTVSRCSDEPYKLFQHTIDGDKEVTENVTWSIEYFEDNGTHLDETDTTAKNNYQNIIAYMPKLDYQKNTLLPAPMYTEFDNGTFIVPVIVCKIGSNVVWTQPIVITQNNYASSTLNEWNGEFKIDEANGTILSTMVGAGVKTENNTFEGVLMGDIQRGANFDSNNASGIGIYGFNDGAQSFYLGVDGRAFFGKSGRGRIYFDGNQGTIASASYLQNKKNNPIEESNTAYAEYKVPITDEDGKVIGYEIYNSSGMLIDLDDGFIDIKGTTYADNAGTSYLDKHELYTKEEWDSLPDDSQFKYTPIYTEGEWNRLSNKEHSSYDDYIALAQPTALSSYDDYVTAYDVDDIYIKSYKQSHIHIDAKSPYLIVHSGQQFDENKHLIEISDKAYYLQTDDYTITEFDYSDGGIAGDGKGFRLDLKNSLLNAYKLKITSKNLFLNSTSNNSEPYFVIKHNQDLNDDGTSTEKSYKNLMYVGSDNYYLQSANYIPMSSDEDGHMGQGMRLDLAGNSPKITAYNFDLRAGNVKGGSTKDATTLDVYLGSHEIIITDQGTSDGNPYFQINTVDSNDKTKVKTLVNITQFEQSLQSADYLAPTNDVRGKGMRISLSGKELKAYSGFTLKAFKDNTDNYILIDATAGTYPLLVYGQSTVTNDDNTTSIITKEFKVNWNGGLEATGANITGTINATGGTFSGTVKVTGTLDGGTIKGSSIYAKTLDIGNYTLGTPGSGNFYVTEAGKMVATSATIGGWEVSNVAGSQGFTYSGVGQMLSSGFAYGGNDANAPFYVDAAGNLKATSAVFDTSLTVKASRGTTNILEVDNTGNTTINGYLTIGANYIYLTTDKTGGAYIYASATDTFLVKNASTISLEGTTLNIGKAGSTINLGTSTGTASNTYVQGNLYFKSNIYTHNGSEYKSGYTKNVTISSWTMGNVSFTFVNGICTMVSGGTSTESGDISGGSDIPDIGGNSNKYLQVNSAATGLEWQTAYPPTSKGSSGQVWTSNGSNGEPGWSTPSSSVDWTSVTNKPSGLTGSYRRVYSVAKGSSNGTIKYRYSDLYFTDGILTSAGTLTWSGDITIYTAPSSE